MNIDGTTASELLRGTNDSDAIRGNGGDDTIVGGFDSLDGGDLIVALAGMDLIISNGGNDTVSSGAGSDTVVTGYGDDYALGNQGDDLMLGNQGNDTLIGGQGSDTIFGGQGDDLINGSEGVNVVYGNEGVDTLDLSSYSRSQVAAALVGGDAVFSTSDGVQTDVSKNNEIEFVRTSEGTFAAADFFPQPPAPPAPPFVARTDFASNQVLPADDRNAAGNFDNGDGTTPSTGFEQVISRDAHAHIAVRLDYRQGPTISPVSTTHDGTTLTLDYNSAAGPQSTANGSFANNANRAAAQRLLDFGTDDGTTIADFLAGNKLFRQDDTDPSAAVSGPVYRAVIDASGIGVDYVNVATGANGVTDDTGDAQHSANSWNDAFAGNPIASFTPGSTFTSRYWIEDNAGHTLASVVMNDHLV